jgi:hypothetical protein
MSTLLFDGDFFKSKLDDLDKFRAAPQGECDESFCSSIKSMNPVRHGREQKFSSMTSHEGVDLTRLRFALSRLRYGRSRRELDPKLNFIDNTLRCIVELLLNV